MAKDLNTLYFPGKRPDEQIIVALKRHFIAIGRKITLFVIAGLVPLGLYVLVRWNDWLADTSSIWYLVVVLAASLFYLFLLLFIYHAWVDYYLDVWIITNERIVAMEQRGLFNRFVSELRLDKIQDVSSEVKGFLPTIFKFGAVHVQTASEANNFRFTDVPHPELVARQILQLHEQFMSQQPTVTPPPVEPAPPTPPPYASGAV